MGTTRGRYKCSVTFWDAPAAAAGGGDENTLAPPVNHGIFDDGDAGADFENMLLPPAGAATITQPQGGVYPRSPKGGAHLGVQPYHPRRTYQGEAEMQASNRRRGTSHTPASAPQ